VCNRAFDLSDLAFDAQTTLAYAENSTDTGGTLTVTDGATPPPSRFSATTWREIRAGSYANK